MTTKPYAIDVFIEEGITDHNFTMSEIEYAFDTLKTCRLIGTNDILGELEK